MEQAGAHLIELRRVTKVYRVGSVDINALRGVDLVLDKGDICCVVGRSGSGKSTLLNVLAGLEHPTAGEIVISRMHIERMTQSELIRFRQKNVGFVFQSFNLMPITRR
jgi:putative ABC transport system ATP-binding protein